MIKFFRKIRQNLLSAGKTGQYFKYAIGEILLVVIGIIIALQINNWNEDRKEKLKEAEILSYAIENLRSDSLSLVNIIDNANAMLQVQNDLISLSQGKMEESDITNLNPIRKSEPNQIITKKNNLDLPNKVRSQTLKKSILAYFLRTDGLEFTITNYNELIEQKVRPFLGQKKLLNYGVDLSTRGLFNSNLINRDRFFLEFKNEEIQQILFESSVKLYIIKNNADRMLGENAALITLIKNYLDK